jgi:hypothetical protein
MNFCYGTPRAEAIEYIRSQGDEVADSATDDELDEILGSYVDLGYKGPDHILRPENERKYP